MRHFFRPCCKRSKMESVGRNGKQTGRSLSKPSYRGQSTGCQIYNRTRWCLGYTEMKKPLCSIFYVSEIPALFPRGHFQCPARFGATNQRRQEPHVVFSRSIKSE